MECLQCRAEDWTRVDRQNTHGQRRRLRGEIEGEGKGEREKLGLGTATDNCSVVELSYRLAGSLMDPSPHVLSEQSHASAHFPTGADRTMARGKSMGEGGDASRATAE